MNKTKEKCPRCHSDKLYKFGLDTQANQKYQCKKCRRQFAPDSVSTPKESKYPKCTKCWKATFLHHAYKYYNRYKCGNKKCNHVIVHHHNLNIDNASSENIEISHVPIASWAHKFAPFFKQKADSFKEHLNLQSDDWHADETAVSIVLSMACYRFRNTLYTNISSY